MTSKVSSRTSFIKVKGHSQQYMQLSVTSLQLTLINNIILIVFWQCRESQLNNSLLVTP